MKTTDLRFTVIGPGRARNIKQGPGEIVIHTFMSGAPSGALLLRCPACNGRQHIVAKIEGPDNAPTITTPIRCGCAKCLKTFRIRGGVPHMIQEEGKVRSPKLADDLKEAGAFYPSEQKRGWRKQ